MEKPTADSRSPEQIREHYEIEKELASRLRNAPPGERRHLYSALYDELFRRVPHHPMLTRKSSPGQVAERVAAQMSFLQRFLTKDSVFLEIGAGDCSLSQEVAGWVRKVYAIDVSEEVTRGRTPPPNFQLVIFDGCTVPVLPDSVDVAYSNQLMEHLHPDDAAEQLRSICRALVAGGTYVCVTPNRLAGPHDISMYFDEVATGFHLREYSTTELADLFRKAGFSRVHAYATVKGKPVGVPLFAVTLFEKLLAALPFALARRLAGRPPFSSIIGVRLAGSK